MSMNEKSQHATIVLERTYCASQFASTPICNLSFVLLFRSLATRLGAMRKLYRHQEHFLHPRFRRIPSPLELAFYCRLEVLRQTHHLDSGNKLFMKSVHFIQEA